MPQPRSTTYRSAGLSQNRATQYTGNAFVYVLASRIDPNLCKIGKGNPAARCDHWNINSPHGGILNNNLSVFAAYSFETEAEALECESQAHAIYSFVNLNPNAAGGEQEFFGVPPQQAKATLNILYTKYVAQQLQEQQWDSALANHAAKLNVALATAEERVKAARIEGYNSAPMVIAQREEAERAQREARKRAQRDADKRAAKEAVERTNQGLREAATRAEATRRAAAAQIEMDRLIEEGKRKDAERDQRNTAAREKVQREKTKHVEMFTAFKRNVLWPIFSLSLFCASLYYHGVYKNEAQKREAARALDAEKSIENAVTAEKLRKAAKHEADERARVEATERKAQVTAKREQAQREQIRLEQAQMQQTQQEKAPRMHSIKLGHKSTGEVLFLRVSGFSADDATRNSIVVYYLENGYKLLQVF